MRHRRNGGGSKIQGKSVKLRGDREENDKASIVELASWSEHRGGTEVVGRTRVSKQESCFLSEKRRERERERERERDDAL